MGPTTKHRWAYACSKAIDEFLALAYWKEKKLPVIIVRFFNTVGPRQTGRYGMVIPNFVRQGLAGQPITVHRRRHADAQLLLRRRRRRGAAAAGGRTARRGRGVQRRQHQEISIMALAEKVRDLTGSRSEIVIDSLRSGLRGRLRRHAAARARPEQDSRLVGYAPKWRSTRSSTRVVDHFQRQ